MGLNITIFYLYTFLYVEILSSVQKENQKFILPPFGNYFYLYQKISYLKVVRFFIHWNKKISVTIIPYLSCQVIWCLIKPYWIYSRTRYYNSMWKSLIIILQRHITKTFMCTGVTSIILLEDRHSWNSWCCTSTFQCLKNQNETIFVQYNIIWFF